MPDCELIRATFPAQPVAAYTALGFLVVGAWSIRKRSVGPVVFGVTLMAVGATSFWLHGWAVARAGTAESVAVIAAVSWLATWVVRRPDATTVRIWLAAVVVVGPAVGLVPSTRHLLTGIAVTGLGLATLRSPQLRTSRRLHVALGIFATALGVYALSRTGGPWCRPDSLIQGHGLWHLLAASALWLVGKAVGATEKGASPCP